MKYIIIAETGAYMNGKPLLDIQVNGFEPEEASKIFRELYDRVKDNPEMTRGCE